MPPCCLYVDADRFYFAVEALEQPGLADDPRPIIVGHDPRTSPRGIVTTANDAARALGIHSGLSAAIALRRAPDAVFLRPRRQVYSRYSERVMAVLRAASPLVQQNSIDEAACAWDHHGFAPEPALALRARVLAETGLSVSLGVASSPLVGKMASEQAKRASDHLCVVPSGTEADFLAPLPIRALIGVGPKSEARLLALGIETIGALASADLGNLADRFGPSYARYLVDAARGIDDSTLSDTRQSKSISAERTFAEDTRDRRDLWREIRTQSNEVAERLREERLLASEVAIKLRYANWETLTRQMRLGAPTDEADVLAAGAAALMRRHWDRDRPVRLIGVRAARLSPAGPALQPALLAFVPAHA